MGRRLKGTALLDAQFQRVGKQGDGRASWPSVAALQLTDGDDSEARPLRQLRLGHGLWEGLATQAFEQGAKRKRGGRGHIGSPPRLGVEFASVFRPTI